MANKADIDESEAFQRGEEMRQTKEYLDRGRRFKRLATEELRQIWIAAVRRFVASGFVAQDPGMTEWDDVDAEFRLRGLDLPWDAVKPETAAMHAEILRSGPDTPMRPEFYERLRAFRAERERPN